MSQGPEGQRVGLYKVFRCQVVCVEKPRESVHTSFRKCLESLAEETLGCTEFGRVSVQINHRRQQVRTVWHTVGKNRKWVQQFCFGMVKSSGHTREKYRTIDETQPSVTGQFTNVLRPPKRLRLFQRPYTQKTGTFPGCLDRGVRNQSCNGGPVPLFLLLELT